MSEDGYRISDKRVRARKAHACNFCDDAITPGTTYVRPAFLFYDEQSVTSIAAHEACYEILMQSLDGFYDVEWAGFVKQRIPYFTRRELEHLTPEEGDRWFDYIGEDWARVRPLCVGKK